MRFTDDSSSKTISPNDELVAMEENYSSIELGAPNGIDDELSRAVFRVQKTLLDNRPLYLQICKNEFAALLLKALGPDKITSSVVDDLFNEIDIDNDGWLSAEELATYMIKVEQQSRIEKFTFFYDRLVHASILGSFSFVCASTISITKNLFVRFYGHEHAFTVVAYELVVWLSLIGGILFLWSAIYNARMQMRRGTENLSFLAKLRLLARFFLAIDQAITAFWLLGAISYVAELWLFGGLCYFVGGMLAFPSLYQSTLDELVQNDQLVQKLRTSFSSVDLDKEMNNSFATCHVPRILDDTGSVGSDLSELEPENDMLHNDELKILFRGRKRSGTDSNVIFVIQDIPDQQPKVRHRRSPTCPDDLFRSPSVGTWETEALTDTESAKSPNSDLIAILCDDVVKHNHQRQPFRHRRAVTCANVLNVITLATCETAETESIADSNNESIDTSQTFLGKDIDLITKPKTKQPLHCYDAFKSLSDGNSNIDQSFRLVKRLSQSNLIDLTVVHQSASDKTMKDLRHMAFRQQFQSPSFYIAALYTIGGFMFSVAECKVFPESLLPNFYLIGSTLFFCGSAAVLYRVTMNVSDEWDLLQESRMSLHAMTETDLEIDEECIDEEV